MSLEASATHAADALFQMSKVTVSVVGALLDWPSQVKVTASVLLRLGFKILKIEMGMLVPEDVAVS